MFRLLLRQRSGAAEDTYSGADDYAVMPEGSAARRAALPAITLSLRCYAGHTPLLLLLLRCWPHTYDDMRYATHCRHTPRCYHVIRPPLRHNTLRNTATLPPLIRIVTIKYFTYEPIIRLLNNIFLYGHVVMRLRHAGKYASRCVVEGAVVGYAILLLLAVARWLLLLARRRHIRLPLLRYAVTDIETGDIT